MANDTTDSGQELLQNQGDKRGLKEHMLENINDNLLQLSESLLS